MQWNKRYRVFLYKSLGTAQKQNTMSQTRLIWLDIMIQWKGNKLYEHVITLMVVAVTEIWMHMSVGNTTSWTKRWCWRWQTHSWHLTTFTLVQGRMIEKSTGGAAPLFTIGIRITGVNRRLLWRYRRNLISWYAWG